MSNGQTYDDYLQRVDIQDVLKDAGYKLHRRDGLMNPTYVRTDSDGHQASGDTFIVNSGGKGCFRPAGHKVYDVPGFIKAHSDLFKEYTPGMDKDQLVKLVCRRILNEPMAELEVYDDVPNRDVKPFRLSDYSVSRYNPIFGYEFRQRAFDGYFAARGISHETQKAFKDHFFLARGDEGKEGKGRSTSLAFPLTIPGKEGVVGLEQRGKDMPDGISFQSRIEGSNGAEGLWIANLSGQPLDKANTVYWFKSAYDAMACHQLLEHKRYNHRAVYVSTGGNPADKQIQGMLAVTPNAHHLLGFGKDMAGKRSIDNFRKVAADMGMRRFKVEAWQPIGFYKDWNDALLGKKDMTLRGVEGDFDYRTRTFRDDDGGVNYNALSNGTDVKGLDLTKYLDTLKDKNDIFSGDVETLPEPLSNLYQNYEQDKEEVRETSVACPEYMPMILEDSVRSEIAYKNALHAAVADYREQHKPFRLSDYEISRYKPHSGYESRHKVFDRWFGPRGISHETQEVFKNHFFLAAKHKEDSLLAYASLAFPLSIPGKEGIVGLEERGKVRSDGTIFKGKAEGSDAAGLWIANLSGKPLDKAEAVYWFESAYDAMAYYQLGKHKENGIHAVYVSTGGKPADRQIRGMLMATAPYSRHYMCFDKDMAGKQSAAEFLKIAKGMNFPGQVMAWQPLGYYKDWNDALLNKKDMTLTGVTDNYDYKLGYDPVWEEKQRQQRAAFVAPPPIDNLDIKPGDLDKYLASLEVKGNIYSGDTGLLPEPLRKLNDRRESDAEEYYSVSHGFVHTDDQDPYKERAMNSLKAYGQALKAAVDDHMRRVNSETKTEDKGKEETEDSTQTVRRGYHR